MNLEINVEESNGIVFLHIKGEVDLYSSPDVRKKIFEIVKHKAPVILVNLEQVKYMDSSGVATLIEGLQQSNKYNGRFALYGLQNNVKEVFELTRLDKIFAIYPDRDSAIGKKDA
ncbi:MAG TPA: STAS domain-containing protein [bacterium]|nr:STAS domain-containing protein [bacterium]HPN45001.1 STAS domain-containing protein [bacterium]